jgi:hypothetical protein
VARPFHRCVPLAPSPRVRIEGSAGGSYTGAINTRFRWTGHLFQGRFGAVAMDEPHLLAASRYIALNPVVAGLVRYKVLTLSGYATKKYRSFVGAGHCNRWYPLA